MSNLVTYSSKATAARGLARHLGAAADKVDAATILVQTDGRWGFDKDAADKAAGLGGNPEDENFVLTCGHSHCPSCGVHLSNGLMDFDTLVDDHGPAKAYASQKHEWSCMGCGHEWGNEIPAPKGAKKAAPATGRHYENKSEVTGAVKASWAIFNANPDLRRKDAIQKAVDGGIAFYTARTQYQKWFKAGKGKGVAKG